MPGKKRKAGGKAKKKSTSKPLAGMTFCVTGTFSVGRKELNKEIVSAGGKVAATVTKAVTHLLCEGDEGSAKYAKAKGKGIPIKGEDWVRALMDGEEPSEEEEEEEEEEIEPEDVEDFTTAAFEGDLKALKAAISATPSIVDETNERGQTALYCAARNGFTKIVQTLLEADANPNVTDGNKSTPLHAAAYYGHAPCVKKLLSNGAKPSMKNVHGLTAHDEAKNDKIKSLIENHEEEDDEPPKKKKKVSTNKTKPAKKKPVKKKVVVKEESEEEEEEEEEEESDEPPPPKKKAAKKSGGGSGGKVQPDKFLPGRDSYTVVGEFHCKLNQTNVGSNNNKFYVLQMVQKGASYSVWTRWGRVGDTGQNKLITCGSSKDAAEKAFGKKFRDKTKNAWENRGSFVKHSGKYQLVETEEGGDDDGLLGKLTVNQIKKGQKVLADLEKVLSKKKKGNLTELSSQFFSLIPTNFGWSKPKPITTMDELHEKEELLKFYLRMGFDDEMEDEPEDDLTPIDGVMNLPIPASLKAAAAKVCASGQIATSDNKAKELFKDQIGQPDKHMAQKFYAALLLYTSNAIYAQLNKVLRDEKRADVKKYFEYLRLLLESFDYLPGNKKKLWRGISVDLFEQYNVGDTITWWGVSSCTADQNVARNFMNSCGGKTTLFTIDSKSSCDISKITFYSNEKESLLAPGTQLRVTSKKRVGKVTEIGLKELGRVVG